MFPDIADRWFFSTSFDVFEFNAVPDIVPLQFLKVGKIVYKPCPVKIHKYYFIGTRNNINSVNNLIGFRKRRYDIITSAKSLFFFKFMFILNYSQ